MIREERVSTELADSLYNILHKMQGGGLVSVADTMMNQSLTYCSDSSLADCLELRSWQRLEVCLQAERAGLEGREGGVMPGNGPRSDSLGSPGRPMGGLVPGGMWGSIPAIGLRASGGGSPRFSASSICLSSGG